MEETYKKASKIAVSETVIFKIAGKAKVFGKRYLQPRGPIEFNTTKGKFLADPNDEILIESL